MKKFAGEQLDKDTALMWQYLNQEQYDYQRPEHGEIRKGIILHKDRHEIILDIGVKLDGVVQSQDLEKLDKKEIESLNLGDEISVYIISPEEVNNRIPVSIHMAKSQEDWNEAQRLMDSGEIFDGEVTDYNKGGLIVSFGQLRGFIPVSQMMDIVASESNSNTERLKEMVGHHLKLKVIEVHQKRRRLILSERAAMKEWRAEQKQRLINELEAGQVHSGVVTNLMNFGAFVDLGGADGLVHVSELAWHRIKHPKEILAVGEKVKVQVLDVDKQNERIALSIKRLHPDPWSQVEVKYAVGDLVEGEVTNLTDFGAFARLEAGLEGLIHISELSEAKVNHPREVIHRGQRITIRIISIDRERQRIGLSLKRTPKPLGEEKEGNQRDLAGEEQ